MYAQTRAGDSLDAFRGYQGSFQASSYYPQQAAYGQMASAAVQPPAYGAPGSFAGRKSVQPPGGYSTLALGDGSGYSPYSQYGAYQRQGGDQSILSGGAGAYGSSSASAYGQGGYSPGMYQGGNADLSNQLNLPNALRRPPSSGRRAMSQPDSYGASSSYGAGAGAGAGYGAGAYGASSAYGNAGGQAYSPYGQAGQYGASSYGASAYGGAGAYGGASAGYGGASAAQGGGYQSSPYGGYAAASSPKGSSQYGGGGAYGGYGNAGASAYGGGAAAYGAYGNLSSPTGSNNNHANYVPGPAATPVFHAGQKGQFCGKIIMQPPGGKTTLNVFG